MKSLLMLLIVAGAAGFFIVQQRQENDLLKAKLTRLTERFPEAEAYDAKPLEVTAIPANAARPQMIHKRVICPQCKGEGALMVRRPVNGSITDVKTMDALCMGTGKREFDIPALAEICPDCGGMGKRIVTQNGSGHVSEGGRELSRGPGGGRDLSGEAPTTSSCPRCLGKGYILRPGKL